VYGKKIGLQRHFCYGPKDTFSGLRAQLMIVDGGSWVHIMYGG